MVRFVIAIQLRYCSLSFLWLSVSWWRFATFETKKKKKSTSVSSFSFIFLFFFRNVSNENIYLFPQAHHSFLFSLFLHSSSSSCSSLHSLFICSDPILYIHDVYLKTHAKCVFCTISVCKDIAQSFFNHTHSENSFCYISFSLEWVDRISLLLMWILIKFSLQLKEIEIISISLRRVEFINLFDYWKSPIIYW